MLDAGKNALRCSKAFPKTFQEPSGRGPQVRCVVAAQDRFEQIEVERWEGSGGTHQFLEPARERRPAEPFHERTLRSRCLKQLSPALDLAHAKLPMRFLSKGIGMIEKANRDTLHRERLATPRGVKRALGPIRVRNAQQLQGAMVRKDAVRSCRLRHEKWVGLKALDSDPRGNHGVQAALDELEPSGLEVMLQALDSARPPTGRSECLRRLVEREYGASGEVVAVVIVDESILKKINSIITEDFKKNGAIITP